MSDRRGAAWSVYIVRCRDGSLYTGVATDVARRLGEHRAAAGRGAKYLRGRGPLTLVLRRRVGARGLAQRIERAVKRLPKGLKESLIGRPDRLSALIHGAGLPRRGTGR